MEGKYFFKKDKALKLKNEQRNQLISFIKTYFNIKYNFILKYVFFLLEKKNIQVYIIMKIYSVFIILTIIIIF